MRTLGAFLLLATCAFYTSEASTPTSDATRPHPTTEPSAQTGTAASPATRTAASTDTDTGTDDESSAMTACERSPCPRNFDPVCYAEDGVHFQAANFCEFRNKVRCGVKAGRKYRLLHPGPCLVRTVVHVKKTITKAAKDKKEHNTGLAGLINLSI